MGAQDLNRQINQTVNSGQKATKGKPTTEQVVLSQPLISKQNSTESGGRLIKAT